MAEVGKQRRVTLQASVTFRRNSAGMLLSELGGNTAYTIYAPAQHAQRSEAPAVDAVHILQPTVGVWSFPLVTGLVLDNFDKRQHVFQ